jgi:putative DNA primase/helicase
LDKTPEQRAKEAVDRALAKKSSKRKRGGNGFDKTIAKLAQMGELAYQRERISEAAKLGIGVAALDKLVRKERAKASQEAAEPAHWKVEPSQAAVNGAELLADIKSTFCRYIVLPKGAADALALWVLHAWTMDAGDISPFIGLVSPTKRCGKTSVLILLLYLTPRSELASNISGSALFRYIEESRPTLLIDEADSFVKDNEEMRGILNSGHTKAAAHVIRNIEVNGEHKPRRFSTWAPKAIATIRTLADTLEDRAIVVQLQRKPPTATVARLRKRDSEEFASLRSRAARWAADNFSKLMDPDPSIPDALNDRAADNWRPLFAIADLAGGTWPQEARQAALVLSGQSQDGAVGVEVLKDSRLAFGKDEVIRSADLVARLTADPERPWAEWKHGRPLTQKQLAGLLAPFHIVSINVNPPGLPQGKGYRRADFEEAWRAYCPGQNHPSTPFGTSDPAIRPCADEMGTTRDFRSVHKDRADGSNNANLSYCHAGLDGWTDRKAENGAKVDIDHEKKEPVCAQCGGPTDKRGDLIWYGSGVLLHQVCIQFWLRRNEPEFTCSDPPTETAH